MIPPPTCLLGVTGVAFGVPDPFGLKGLVLCGEGRRLAEGTPRAGGALRLGFYCRG
jgi:hypothetical protein